MSVLAGTRLPIEVDAERSDTTVSHIQNIVNGSMGFLQTLGKLSLVQVDGL